MRIGLTFDLRSEHVARGFSEDETAEFDKDETIAGIAGALERLGFSVDRIGNVRALLCRLAGGERWDIVFNIAEGVGGFGREAQVPALLEAYDIPFTFSDSLVCGLTLHKAMTKRVLRDAGLPTADFAVVACADDVRSVNLAFPVFAKPVAEGSSKGIEQRSHAVDRDALESICAALLQRFAQPVLVETYLPGREFTVGILGSGAAAECLGVMEIGVPGAGIYSLAHKRCDNAIAYRLASDQVARDAGTIALAAWRLVGGRDAARIDLRCDRAGRPHILEINALPGLEPGRSDLVYCAERAGLSYDDLIRKIVSSALDRYGLAR